MVKCSKCGDNVDEVYSDGMCSSCVMGEFDEAVKDNPEYYGGNDEDHLSY